MIEWVGQMSMSGAMGCMFGSTGLCFGIRVDRSTHSKRGRSQTVWSIQGEDRLYGSENQLIEECERRARGEYGDDCFEVAKLKHEVAALQRFIRSLGHHPEDVQSMVLRSDDD